MDFDGTVAAGTPGDVHVGNNTELSCYEITLAGIVVGVADYHIAADRVVLPHTEIDRSHRGLGLAERLVRFALDDIRSQGLNVVPSCWYVAQFIDEHPEYVDLLAN